MFTGYITKFLLPFSQVNSLELPIGTILPYVGNLADIPKGWYLCDGSNGTPDLRNRFLEGTTTKANIFVEAGLPNITGAWDDGVGYQTPLNIKYNAFFTDGSISGRASQDGGYSGLLNMFFDASRSNSIYGNSNTVQPNSYTVYFIMRISINY